MDQNQVKDNVDTNSIQQKVDTNLQPVKETQKSAELPKETEDQINWRKFREQREVERKQNEELQRKATEKENEANALKAAMEAILNKPAQNSSNYQTNEEEETEDQRIEKKVKIAIDQERNRRDEHQRKLEIETFPKRLNADFKDFNQVCTTENLDYLDYHYPEVAGAFKFAPDGYDKWAAVYKAVKKLVPNMDAKKDQKKIESNMNKPGSASSQHSTPTGMGGTPHILSDQKRAANWERMQKSMKGLS